MLFERIISEGLAHFSYLIGSGDTAAVIDPRRDCDVYLDIAEKNDCTITHIFETHRNEDYVIGSRELAGRCGAGIYHGAMTDFQYGTGAHEGDRFEIGSLRLSVIETPGHTPESISLILRDTESGDEPFMVFCGDTLFAGDIARTDFFGQDRRAEMALRIHDSITQKILPLGDGVIVCPAHGAGSVCGSEITDHPFTSVGYERRTNPMLALGRDVFAGRRVNESLYLPPYFRQMETVNLQGAPILPASPRLPRLPVAEVNRLIKSGCQTVDIRSPPGFGGGHIPGSLSIWRDGLPAFMGWFLDYERPIVLVDDFNLSTDTVLWHFLRLGYDNITGFLAGGFSAWARAAQEIAMTATCSVQELKERLENESPFLLDVRDIRNRQSAGHIRHSHHIYVGELPGHLGEVPRNEPVVVYCDAGYKGSLAASILSLHKYRNVTNVLGGMHAWKRAGYRIEK